VAASSKSLTNRVECGQASRRTRQILQGMQKRLLNNSFLNLFESVYNPVAISPLHDKRT
jgi:hypothetical protein